MTTVKIRRIGNGWLLETPDLDWFFESIEHASGAAMKIADMPSLNEEISRALAQTRAISEMFPVRSAGSTGTAPRS